MTRDEILDGIREAMRARNEADDRLAALVVAAEGTDLTWDELGQAISVDGEQAYTGRDAWEWLSWVGYDALAIGPEPPAEWFVPKAR